MALLLSSGFVELGHTCVIAACSTAGEFSDYVAPNVRLINLMCKKPIKGTRELSDLVNRVAPDSVIAFGMHTGIAAVASKIRFGWRSQIIIRNENNLKADWSQADLLNRTIGPVLSRWAARRSTVVAVSNALAKPTASFLNILEQDVVAIRNPVFGNTVESLDQDNSLHPWLLEKRSPTLVAAGRFEHQKGFDTLIRAFSLVSPELGTRLVIFGDGSLRRELQSLIDSLQLQDRVDLPGFTASLSAQMRSATAFVVSSRFEGFGLVIVEALAAQTQVIATDCEYGPSELLEHGRFGTLVPVDNEAVLANAMTEVIRGKTPSERPPDVWFQQFTAAQAAKDHLALIQKHIVSDS